MLKQKPGEATVKVGATFQPADGSQGLAAANGAQFNFDRSLGAPNGHLQNEVCRAGERGCEQ